MIINKLIHNNQNTYSNNQQQKIEKPVYKQFKNDIAFGQGFNRNMVNRIVGDLQEGQVKKVKNHIKSVLQRNNGIERLVHVTKSMRNYKRESEVYLEELASILENMKDKTQAKKIIQTLIKNSQFEALEAVFKKSHNLLFKLKIKSMLREHSKFHKVTSAKEIPFNKFKIRLKPKEALKNLFIKTNSINQNTQT